MTNDPEILNLTINSEDADSGQNPWLTIVIENLDHDSGVQNLDQ